MDVEEVMNIIDYRINEKQNRLKEWQLSFITEYEKEKEFSACERNSVGDLMRMDCLKAEIAELKHVRSMIMQIKTAPEH